LSEGVSFIAQAGIAIAAVGYFAASLPIILGLIYLIQRFYLRTSRQLRVLEWVRLRGFERFESATDILSARIEAKAPLFTHFGESLSGLITIRAFGWVKPYENKSLHLLDTAQRPYYLLLCIQRWLVLVLNLVIAGMAILLMGLAVALRGKINPGLLGVALVMMMSMGHTLDNFVVYWTLLETSLGAVARIKRFSEDTPSELPPGCEGNEVAEDKIAEKGAVEFRDVEVKYRWVTPASHWLILRW
jgi:ATP-binding cassette, subfamily C (CFTR/MRP), member 1